MTGIYIHIPFCGSRCVYCGFYSTTALDKRQRYVEALISEIAMRPSPDTVATIYLGGGTPSQLTLAQLRQLFDALNIYNKVSPTAEVTIEVNPDDVTPEFAEGLRSLPVNRVSMGVQTFSDERLTFLHRRHTASQVPEAVRLLRQAGIANISIDLMYGFPDESLSDWTYDISQAVALRVEHLSAYSLMIEEGTSLHSMHLEPIDEDTERQMYETLIDHLSAAGFEHYEISNFAQPGFRSRHNSSYWTGIPYIGLGAAAHSYDIQSRSWNVADITRYIEAMERGERPFESEQLDDDTRYNDLVPVALRTKEGLNLASLSEKYRSYCLKCVRPYLTNGLLSLNATHLHLTRQGLFVSDMIMSDMIYI